METFGREEVTSALRNREMPLEALALDRTPVGMHYLLAHFDIPLLAPDRWRLDVGGRVSHQRSLTLSDLRALRARTEVVTLECAGNGRALMSPRHPGHPWHLGGVSTQAWTGVPLREVLESAGVLADALSVAFVGADEGVEDGIRQAYAWGLTLDGAMRDEILLAFEMDGRPLEPQHGAPVRLVVPGWYGMASVKWLRRIEVLEEPFEGPQTRAYRLKQRDGEVGEPISRIRPRALAVPPGIPDEDGIRLLDARSFRLVGRAWSGEAAVERVEVRIDAGGWRPAELEPPLSSHAWAAWTAVRTLADDGVHEVSIRATDATGSSQPDEPVWNLWGYANNGVQRFRVQVRN